MTPARSNGKTGSFIINRRFKNVGVIRRPLGTVSMGEYRDRIALVKRIHKQGHYELLREFAKPHSKVTIEYLVELDMRGELGLGLSTLATRENLWDAIEHQLPVMAEAAATRARYATSFRCLQRKAKKWLPDRAIVADLERVPWKELKPKWDASGTDWMHMRRAVGRFLTLQMGDVYHPFRRAVMNKDKFPHARVGKRRPSLSFEQFMEIIERVPEPARPAYWCILIVGMRLGEYCAALPEHLNPSTQTIFIPGRKTEDSEGLLQIDERVYPRVASAIPRRFGMRYYQDTWAEAFKASGITAVGGVKKITIHDLRHIHGHWAINAGVPESMVQASFRHKSPGMTRDYVMQQDSGVVSAAIADVITSHHTSPHRTTGRKRA